MRHVFATSLQTLGCTALLAAMLMAPVGCSLLIDPGANTDSLDASSDASLSSCPATPFPLAEYTELCFADSPSGLLDSFQATAGKPIALNLVSSDADTLSVNGALVLDRDRARAEGSDLGLAERCAEAGAFTAEVVMRYASEQDPAVGFETRRLIDFRSASNPVFVLGTNTSNTEIRLRSVDGQTGEWTQPIEEVIDRRLHIVATYGQSSWQLYVNGIPAGSSPMPASIAEWSARVESELELRIGDSPFQVPSRSWWGRVAFVGLYCAQMDAAQLEGRYEMFKALDR